MVAAGSEERVRNSTSRRSYSSSTGKGYVAIAFVMSSSNCYFYLNDRRSELLRQIRLAQIYFIRYSLLFFTKLHSLIDIDAIFKRISASCGDIQSTIRWIDSLVYCIAIFPCPIRKDCNSQQSPLFDRIGHSGQSAPYCCGHSPRSSDRLLILQLRDRIFTISATELNSPNGRPL
jgi:hypothetical protein